MARPRCQILPQNPETSYFVHLISRCVRGAFLCGTDAEGRVWDHRKVWIRNRLRLLDACFGIRVDTYAIMSNHIHVLVQVRPQDIQVLSDADVCRRWLTVRPKAVERLRPAHGGEAEAKVIAVLLEKPAQVAVFRRRLCDVGWYMKELKEHVARTANHEENKAGIGAFWQGRYKSIVLSGEKALSVCRVYVDSNPLRAGRVKSVEETQDTGFTERLARQKQKAQAFEQWLEQRRKTGSQDAFAPMAGWSAEITDDTRWLASMKQCGKELSLEKYVQILEYTTRIPKPGKANKQATTTLALKDYPHLGADILGMSPDEWAQQVLALHPRRGRRRKHAA